MNYKLEDMNKEQLKTLIRNHNRELIRHPNLPSDIRENMNVEIRQAKLMLNNLDRWHDTLMKRADIRTGS